MLADRAATENAIRALANRSAGNNQGVKMDRDKSSGVNVLRWVRERTGLTQAKLAQKAGVPPPLVHYIESGQRGLSPDAAVKFASALKAEPVALFLTHNVERMKQRVAEGEVSSSQAFSLAKRITDLVESGDLNQDQTTVARDAVKELVKLVEANSPKVATKSGGKGIRVQDDYSPGYTDTMLYLGRDALGRALPEEELKRRREEESGAGGVAEKSAGGFFDTYEYLGRDSLGRPKKGSGN